MDKREYCQMHLEKAAKELFALLEMEVVEEFAKEIGLADGDALRYSFGVNLNHFIPAMKAYARAKLLSQLDKSIEFIERTKNQDDAEWRNHAEEVVRALKNYKELPPAKRKRTE